VRINPTNIPTQVSRNQSASSAHKSTDLVTERQKTLREDSYQRNSSSSAQVIDAEYVEFYTPAPQSFAQERQALDSRLDINMNDASYQRHAASNGKTEQYQIQTHQAPPPGTYIDTFA
jgi:hypothetical protein